MALKVLHLVISFVTDALQIIFLATPTGHGEMLHAVGVAVTIYMYTFLLFYVSRALTRGELDQGWQVGSVSQGSDCIAQRDDSTDFHVLGCHSPLVS